MTDLAAWRIAAVRRTSPLRRVVVLVPTRAHADPVRRALAVRLGGLLNVDVLTLDDVARECAAATGALRASVLAPTALRALVGRAAHEITGYYESGAASPGFVDALTSLFSDLRAARVASEGLSRAAVASETRRKLSSLSPLYERVCSELRWLQEAGHVTVESAFESADPGLLATVFRGVAFVSVGLVPSQTVERRFLERLAAVTQVELLLPVASAIADEALSDSLGWVGSLAAPAGRHPSADRPGRAAVPSALASLQDGLLSGASRGSSDGSSGVPSGDAPGPTELHPAEPAAEPAAGPAAGPPAEPPDGPDRSVEVVVADDAQDEVRRAAGACLRWAAQGMAFGDMKVVFRDPAYRQLLHEVFARAGIPVSDPLPPKVASTPPGRLATRLLSLVGSDLPRAGVVAFLRDATVPTAVEPRPGPGDRSMWDSLSRRAGVVRGAAQWRSRIDALARSLSHQDSGGSKGPHEPDDETTRDLGLLAAFRGTLWRFLDDVAEAPAPGSWTDHTSHFALLCDTWLAGSDEVVRALQAIAPVEARLGHLDWDDYAALAHLLLERADTHPAAGEIGVIVADAADTALVETDGTVVLGLVDGGFPRGGGQDPLLLDHERAQLARALSVHLPGRRSTLAREAHAFALTVWSTGERLVLSRPAGDPSIRSEYRPSPFWTATVRTVPTGVTGAAAGSRVSDSRLVPRLPETRRPDAERSDRPAAKTRAPDTALAACLDLADVRRSLLGSDPATTLPALATRHPRIARGRLAWAKRWLSPRLTEFDGMIGVEAVARLDSSHPLRRPFSATRLETYATCPHRFYLENVLGIVPLDDPEDRHDIDPRDRGTLVHDILETFMRALAPSAPGADPTGEIDLLGRIAAESFDHCEARGRVGHPTLWRHTRRVVLDDLQRWYDHEVDDWSRLRQDDPGWRPAGFEVAFGRVAPGGDDDPLSSSDPLELAAGTTTIRFSGRIDRIDVSPTPDGAPRFRVVDYKTGARNANHRDDDLAGGRALQLPVYLHAAARLVGSSVAEGEAQYYYATRRGAFARVHVGGPALEAGRETFASVLERMAGHVDEGDFHRVPDAWGACRFCDFAPACDVRKERIAARKAGDPLARSFAELSLAKGLAESAPPGRAAVRPCGEPGGSRG